MKERIERSRTTELIAMLATRWPRCFAVYEKKRRPLKIGIHVDIAAQLGDSITADELKATLRCYVSNEAYRDRCVMDAERVDLDGNVVGSVTAEQAVCAAGYVARRIRRRAAAKAIRLRAAAKAAAPKAPTSYGTNSTMEAPAPKPAGRLSLDDLKAAAAARKQTSSAPAHS